MVYNWLFNNLSKLRSFSCFLCGRAFQPHTSNQLCPHCLKDLPRTIQPCSQCGIALNFTGTDFEPLRCGPCRTQPPKYDRVISAFAYANPVRQLISQFKYQRQLAIGSLLSEALVDAVMESSTSVEAILPVPLHQSRIRQRGFNQALELARPLANKLKLPLLLSQVNRQRNTAEQSSLSRKHRLTNLKMAFTLNEPIPYRSLAIVDDVMTTGSTVSELSKLLKNNGVEYIEIWCVARATMN